MLSESLNSCRSPTAWRGLFGCLGMLALGCAQGASHETVTTQRQTVIGGEPSPSSQNAVLVVLGNLSWCTASLVAPTLVMTARHCLFQSTDGSPLNFKCTGPAGGAPIAEAKAATDYTILVGHRHPLTVAARGKRVFGGADLDFCHNDIALLELDTPILEAEGGELAPLPLRLGAPTTLGEEGTLVGWGDTEHEINGPQQLIDQRQQLPLRVLGVGPTDLGLANGGLLTLFDSMFVTDQGGCMGDNGAPLISTATGAIFGILSSLEPDDPTSDPQADAVVNNCLNAHTVFRDLASQSAWVRAAFAETGQAPWLEGYQRPAALGQPCEAGPDCVSGLCSVALQGGFCSDKCDSRACPEDMQCVGPADQRLCVPRVVASGRATSPACAMTANRSGTKVWLALPLLALALSLRRRFRHPVAQ